MKKSILVTAISLMCASAAFAAELNLDQTTADLGACDGYATLVRTSEGKAEIRIKDVRRCSNLTLRMKLDRKEHDGYSIKLPINLGKEADLELSSNSGTTSTHLNVSTIETENLPELYVGANRELRNCMGFVRFNSNIQIPATLVFQGVKNCTTFKILSVNGRPFTYQTRLDDQGQFWGGSFTLPASAIQFGRNRVKVSIEGPMNQDQFMLVFDSHQN